MTETHIVGAGRGPGLALSGRGATVPAMISRGLIGVLVVTIAAGRSRAPATPPQSTAVH
jgi:hypothetical protein